MERSEAGRNRVIGAAALMVTSIGLSRIVGLVRMKVFATWYGASPETDAFVMAFSLPDLVFLLVGGGVVASAFIPYFAERYYRGEERQAWHTFSALLGVVGGSLGLLLLALYIVAPYAIPVIVSKLDPSVHPLCVRLARIMLWGQLFMFFGGLSMGALNARHHYLAPAMGPILYNLSIIGGIVFFGKEIGLEAAAWSVLVGAVGGNMLLQVPALLRIGARFELTFDTRDEGLRRVLLFMVPVIFSLCIIHIDTLISKVLATGDPRLGAATCLENAYRLAMVPVGMFAMGAGVAALPTLSENVARGELDTYVDHVSLSLRTVLFLTIPTFALLGVLGLPIVRAVYEGGQFTDSDSRFTASILLAFAAGIVGLAGQQFLPRAFYALNDSRTPCIIGGASVGLHLALAVSMFPVLGTVGCALATSIASTAAFAAMLVALRRRVGRIDGRRILVSAGRVLLASAASTGAAYWVWLAMSRGVPPGTTHERVLQAGCPLLAGGGLFCLLVPVMRIDEGMAFGRALMRRIRRAPA